MTTEQCREKAYEGRKENMNLVLNRLDNIKIESKSYELFPADKMDEINMCGAIIGINGEYLIKGKNVVLLAVNAGLKPMMASTSSFDEKTDDALPGPNARG